MDCPPRVAPMTCRSSNAGGPQRASRCFDSARYADAVALDLTTKPVLKDAVLRARTSAEADGSLHPRAGEQVGTTAAFREAIERLLADGTYADAVASVITDWRLLYEKSGSRER